MKESRIASEFDNFFDLEMIDIFGVSKKDVLDFMEYLHRVAKNKEVDFKHLHKDYDDFFSFEIKKNIRLTKEDAVNFSLWHLS